MIRRSEPDQSQETDRVWTVDLLTERASVPGRTGDVVHVLEDDSWWLWRPDNTWVVLGGATGAGPHTHPTSDIIGLDAALADTAPLGHTHALDSFVLLTPNALTYTNAPAGGSEVTTSGGTRAQVDLRNAVNVVGQVVFSVIPHASGTARFEYSVNGGSAWAALVDVGAGGYSANAIKLSASTAVPGPAKIATCLVRLVVTGDGVVDPVLQKAALNFQPS